MAKKAGCGMCTRDHMAYIIACWQRVEEVLQLRV